MKHKQRPEANIDVQVPTVRVWLVRMVQVSPQQSAVVQVRVNSPDIGNKAIYLEPDPQLEEDTLLVLEDIICSLTKMALLT